MQTHADKSEENKGQSVATEASQVQSGGECTFQFVDNRPEAIQMRKSQEMANNYTKKNLFQFVDNRPEVAQMKRLQELANNSPQVKQAVQLPAMANNYSAQQQNPVQKKENNTGLPDNLKSGIENLSGYSMDDVKVHRNSDKPAQLQAHAYAQGTDIHLGPGQEKHLPHEAWHVVQQKQGRVKPTMQMKGKVSINDDAGSEKEADIMGSKALRLHPHENRSKTIANSAANSLNGTSVVQGYFENKENKKLSETAKKKIIELWQHNDGFGPMGSILNNDQLHVQKFEDYVEASSLAQDLKFKLQDASKLKDAEPEVVSRELPTSGHGFPSIEMLGTTVPWKPEDLSEDAGVRNFERMQKDAIQDKALMRELVIGDAERQKTPGEHAALLSFVNNTESESMNNYFGLTAKAIGKGERKFVKAGGEYTSRPDLVAEKIKQFAADNTKVFQNGTIIINAHYSYDPKTTDEFLASTIPPEGMARMLFASHKPFSIKKLVILACASENYTKKILVELNKLGVDVNPIQILYVAGNNLFQPWPNPKTQANAIPEFFYAGPEVDRQDKFSSLQKPISSIITCTTGAELLDKKTSPAEANEAFRVQEGLERARAEAAEARRIKLAPSLQTLIAEINNEWLSSKEATEVIKQTFIRLMEAKLINEDNDFVKNAIKSVNKQDLKKAMNRIRGTIYDQAVKEATKPQLEERVNE